MKRALIAEDEFDLLEALKAIMEGQGFSVVSCRDGREALEQLENSQPTLVITDLMMPHVSGLELLRQIRSRDRLSDVPVIMISCADWPSGIKHEEVQAFLKKPFSVKDLLREIDRALEAR